jgi:hypothetical protein
MNRLRVVTVIVVMMTFGWLLTQAQEESTGVIDEANPQVDFTFNLEAGVTARVEVLTTSGDLDPILTIRDSSGSVIIENDDAGINNLNSAAAFTAQVADTYTASVTAWSGTGEFVLRLWTGGEELFEPQYGPGAEIYEGEISESVPAQTITVDLEAGQTIFIVTTALSGDLDTIVTLYNPDGSEAARNDDASRQTFNSALVYTATASGIYTVEVTAYEDSLGAFEMAVTVGGNEVAQQGDIRVGAQSQFFEGQITGGTPEVSYPITLDAGDTILAQTEATSESLDTILALFDPSGELIELNDDLGSSTLDSGIAITVAQAGQYEVVVGSYGETTGTYTLTVTVGGVELIRQLDDRSRVQLSGPRQTIQTEHFVVHYTLEGDDATTPDYAQYVAEVMEQTRDFQINQLGWTPPVPDNDGLYDVYLANVLDEGILGYVQPEGPGDDNPFSEEIEESATSSYMVIDNDFAEDTRPQYTPEELALTTAVHEFNHSIQFGYEAGEPMFWYYEATATWMETQGAGEAQDATGYVFDNFASPEICLGNKDGTYMYGEWTLIQSMVDFFGPQVVEELWRNIAVVDGFAALENTLAAYDVDIPTFMVAYRSQNLVRDYALAPLFETTVRLEGTVSGVGTVSSGLGVEELGANYWEVSAAGNFAVSTDNPDLILAGIGIGPSSADWFYLANGGEISTEGYSAYYLVVVNSNYDDDVDNCASADYSLTLSQGSGVPASVVLTFDTTHFEAP